jgi:hypothetical protein
LAAAAEAHHSFAAEFLGDQTLRYYIEIETEDGETETWDVRTSSPTILVRRGWNRDTISEGDNITVEGYLGRDGRKLLSLIRIELPDGTVLNHSY